MMHINNTSQRIDILFACNNSRNSKRKAYLLLNESDHSVVFMEETLFSPFIVTRSSLLALERSYMALYRNRVSFAGLILYDSINLISTNLPYLSLNFKHIFECFSKVVFCITDGVASVSLKGMNLEVLQIIKTLLPKS